MQSSKFRGTFFAAFAAALLCGFGAKAHADTTVTFNKWVDELKFSGDYRLRYEYFNRPVASETDRKRLRFRLRLNTDFKLPANLMARLTFASGTGEQVSTNQSFTGLGGQKSICLPFGPTTRWIPLLCTVKGIPSRLRVCGASFMSIGSSSRVGLPLHYGRWWTVGKLWRSCGLGVLEVPHGPLPPRFLLKFLSGKSLLAPAVLLQDHS